MQFICATTSLFGIDHFCSEKHINSDIMFKFHQHSLKYGLKFYGDEDMVLRIQQFAKTDRNYQKINQQQSSFKLGHNQFSTLFKEEYEAMLDRKQPVQKGTATSIESIEDIPESVDWRTKGILPPVKNQGQMTRVSLAEFTAFESYVTQMSGMLNMFSYEQAIDCEPQQSFAESFLKYAHDKGMELEQDYPMQKDGKCHFDQMKVKAKVDKIVDVTPLSVKSLKTAIATTPVVVMVDASSPSFQGYSGGILNSDSCGTALNHEMLAVGYGNESGIDYFLLMNSWGASWGDHGYIKVVAKEGKGVCGVQMQPFYATISKSNN